mgnify:CR=1 FL=1
MMEIINKLKLSQSVIEVQHIGDEILAIDNQKQLYFFDYQTFAIKSTLNLCEQKCETRDFNYTKQCALSTRKIVANPLEDGNLEMITLASKQKILVNRPWKVMVEVVVFSDDGAILLAADGRGYMALYYSHTGQVLFELPNNRGYVTAAAISSNNNFLCYCGDDKRIEMINVQTAQSVASFEIDDMVESCRFVGATRVMAVTKKGSIVTVDLDNYAIKITNGVLNSWPTSSVSAQNDNFIIAGNREHELYIIDLANHSLENTLNLENEGVSSLTLDGNRLYIGHKNGVIDVVDYGYKYDELQNACKIKDYNSVNNLIQENVFLEFSKIYIDLLRDGWKETMPLVVRLIGLDKEEKALNLAMPFLVNKHCKKEFDLLLSKNETIRDLLKYALEKQFETFFMIVDADKSLEELPIVKMVRENWNRLYKEAMQKKIKNELMVEMEKKLRPYYSYAPYKKMARDLFEFYDYINEANHYVKTHDFKSFFHLTLRHEFLKENEVYSRVVQLGELLHNRAVTLENDEKFEEALDGFKQLADFKPFRMQSHEGKKRIERKIDLLHLLENKNLIDSSRILKQFPDLNALGKVQTFLYAPFERYSSNLQPFIKKGDVKMILDLLLEYSRLPLFDKKIEIILKFTYLEQMKVACEEKRNVDWQATMERYVSFFGQDLHLEQLSACIEINMEKKAVTRNGAKVINWPESILSFNQDD